MLKRLKMRSIINKITNLAMNIIIKHINNDLINFKLHKFKEIFLLKSFVFLLYKQRTLQYLVIYSDDNMIEICLTN